MTASRAGQGHDEFPSWPEEQLEELPVLWPQEVDCRCAVIYSVIVSCGRRGIFNLVLPKPATNSPARFYRLNWLP